MFYHPFIKSNYPKNIHPETPEEIDIEDALNEDVILRFKPIGNNTYDTGDTITFQIIVKNPYYYQVIDMAINDESGLFEDGNTGNSTIVQPEFVGVPPEATRGTLATYTVTEEDIINGYIDFSISVTIDEEYTFYADLEIDSLEEPNPHISISVEEMSTPANNNYDYGDDIEYKIAVTNDGNLPIYDLYVEDEASGYGSMYGETLYPGDSFDFNNSSTEPIPITVDDSIIAAGEFSTTVTATSTDIEENEITAEETFTIDTIAPINDSMNMTFNVTPPSNGDVYQLGEQVTITATLTNIGNIDLSNISVDINEQQACSDINYLEVNDSYTTPFNDGIEYTITSEDINEGYFTINGHVEWDYSNSYGSNDYSTQIMISDE